MDIEQRTMKNAVITLKNRINNVEECQFDVLHDYRFTQKCVKDLEKDVKAMEKDYIDKCFALAIWNIVNTALIGITIVLLFTRGV